MKTGLILSLVLLGVTSITAQVAIQREMINGFYGNELFVGVVLSSWLFWAAAGSGLVSRYLSRFKKHLLVTLHIVIGVTFFATIFFIRWLECFISLPGEIPDVVDGLIIAFLVPAPLSVILGVWWTEASRVFSGQLAGLVNRAYFLELIGFITGGLLFSFLLVSLREFFLADILIILNSLVAIYLISRLKIGSLFRIVSIVLLFCSIVFLFTPLPGRLDTATRAFRYHDQELVDSKNTPYGNIAVTKIGSQFNFYENGVLTGTTEKVASTEDLAHIALLEHPSPRRVLLIGGGLLGLITEILKQPVDMVVYTELDPNVTGILKGYLPPEFKGVLSDPRVKIEHVDGYYFLSTETAKYDLIIINLPPPSTALINRYYTVNFFRVAGSRLNPDGIFVTALPYSVSAPIEDVVMLNRSVYNSLKGAFKNLIVIAEETVLFLASDGDRLTYDPDLLIGRFRTRGIETEYISEGYLRYRLTNDRNAEAEELFNRRDGVKLNTNMVPAAYYYQNLSWLDYFHPSLSRAYKWAARYFWVVALMLVVLTVVYIVAGRRLDAGPPIFSMAVAGFSLMAMEMMIIFSYQVEVGYLYYRIALLISVLMAGMAFGVVAGNKIVSKGHVWRRVLARLHILIIIFCLLLMLIFGGLPAVASVLPAELVFLTCAGMAGFLGAMIFPVSNSIYLSLQPEPDRKTGTIYGADLAGSSLGALLPSLFLIPVFGIYNGLIFVAVLNIAAVSILFGSFLLPDPV